MLSEMITTVGLLVVAELGDKSQLVCLALAARFRPGWVVLGAVLAFSILNGLAVLAGGLFGAVIPVDLVRLMAVVTFAGFGVHSLLSAAEEDEDPVEAVAAAVHPVLASALLLALAELGDKTQLSVAALAAVQSPWVTWLGATLALTMTSGVAALAGGWLMPRLQRRWVNRVAGALFLAIAAWLGMGVLR